MRTSELLLILVVLLLAWNSIICLAGAPPQQQNNRPTYPLTKIKLTPAQMNAISGYIVSTKLLDLVNQKPPMLKIDSRDTYKGKSRPTMLIIESDVVKKFGPNNPDVLSEAKIKKQTKADDAVVKEIKDLVRRAILNSGLIKLRKKLNGGLANKAAANSYAAHQDGNGETRNIGLTIVKEPNHGANGKNPDGIAKYHVKLSFFVTTDAHKPKRSRGGIAKKKGKG